METKAAPIMAVRSPMRLTTDPLGMSPTSSPSMIMPPMNAAIASEAPRLPATIGMMGMIAPSPMEKRSAGSSAGSATARREKGASGVDIAPEPTRGRPPPRTPPTALTVGWAAP